MTYDYIKEYCHYMSTLLPATLSALYYLLLSALFLLLLLPCTQLYLAAFQQLTDYLNHLPLSESRQLLPDVMKLLSIRLPDIMALLSIKQSFPLPASQVLLLASL